MRKFIFAFLLVMAFALPVQAAEMVTIDDASKEEVYNFVLTACMKNGFMIQESNDHSLIFRNDKTNMNFSLHWGSNTYIQYVFNFAQVDKNVLISYEIRAVNGNQISPFSKEAIPNYFPVNKDDAEYGLNGTLVFLRSLKTYFNGTYIYGFTPAEKKKKDYVEIIEASTDYPAGKAGLKAGDQIIRINDQTVKKISYFAFDTILKRSSLENKPLDLQIRRDKETIDLKIIPVFIPYKRSEAP